MLAQGRRFPCGQGRDQVGGIAVHRGAPELAALLQYNHRSVSFAVVSYSGHALDVGVTIDADVKQHRSCGFLCGI